MEEKVDLENGELEKGKIRKALRNMKLKELRNMKLKKTAGVDGISMEAWKYAGKGLWKEMVSLMKKYGRLEKEVEMKEMIPATQAEKEGQRLTISLCCTMLSKGKREAGAGKIYMLFANLKAAFDKIDKSNF